MRLFLDCHMQTPWQTQKIHTRTPKSGVGPLKIIGFLRHITALFPVVENLLASTIDRYGLGAAVKCFRPQDQVIPRQPLKLLADWKHIRGYSPFSCDRREFDSQVAAGASCRCTGDARRLVADRVARGFLFLEHPAVRGLRLHASEQRSATHPTVFAPVEFPAIDTTADRSLGLFGDRDSRSETRSQRVGQRLHDRGLRDGDRLFVRAVGWNEATPRRAGRCSDPQRERLWLHVHSRIPPCRARGGRRGWTVVDNPQCISQPVRSRAKFWAPILYVVLALPRHRLGNPDPLFLDYAMARQRPCSGLDDG